MASSTFYLLFVIELVGLRDVSYLLAISFLAQAIIDYPSGALADWLGQRGMLTIAYFMHAVAYSLLVIAHNFSTLLVIYLLEGFTKSFESGTMQTWFDNNYTNTVTEEDPEYETYKAIQNRVEMYLGIFSSSMFLLGGLVATWTFRELIFSVQAIGMLSLGVLIALKLTDVSATEQIADHVKLSYFSVFKGGLTLITRNPRLLILVSGIIIVNAALMVWSELILLPIYFGYTGSDAGAGILRFTVWVTTSLMVGLLGFWTKQLTAGSLYKIHLIHPLIFFGFFALFLILVPFQTSLNLVVFGLLVLIFTFTGVLRYTSLFIRKSLFLDLIPNIHRNSFYSLLPTLNLMMATPLMLIIGGLTTFLDLSYLIIILGLLEVIGALLFLVSFKLPLTWSPPVEKGRPMEIRCCTCC